MPPARFDHRAESGPDRVLLVGDRVSALGPVIETELDGVSVLLEDDGDAAIDRLDGDPGIGCVVVTHDPPAVDGLAVLEAVRRRFPRLPFVVRVVDGDEYVVERILDAGATDVVEAEDRSAEALLTRRVAHALGSDGDGTAGDRRLAVLQDLVDRLATADSDVAVGELVERATTAQPSVARASVYLFDDEANVLRPATDDREGRTVGPTDGSPVWDAFVEGEPVAGGFGRDDDGATDRRYGVVAPLEEYGALVVEPLGGGRLDDGFRRFVGTVASVAVQSLRRLGRERTLSEQNRELDRSTDRLDRLEATVDLLLDVETAVTGATSREDVESAVCDRLAEREGVSFVWVGGLDDEGRRLVPRAWAGTERGYLDAVEFSLDDDAGDPSVRAVRDRRVVHVPHVSRELRGASWRRELLNRGHQSVLSLPLVHDGSLSGVLTVCASAPDAFDDLEERVLEEISNSAAYGIDAIERREALVVDSVVELEVRIPESTEVLQRLARHVEGTVSFEGHVSTPDATSMLYVSVSGASTSSVLDFLGDSVSVDDVDHVTDREGDGLFVLTVSDPALVTWVTQAGAAIQALTATPAETRLDVELPRPANVRGFVESLQETYPDAELVTTHTYDRPLTSRRTFMASLGDRLTDRQLEVLETAYRNGYFEWPRTRTGEEIASLLDITQPTFNNHLRVAERKLFSLLFDEETVPGGKHT
ncbi:bacterio-opsin activator domain-containing protein [Haloarchaeobius sp. HRN-SO-5]|uniref:bacterio-opsin activator domain-containing protein n=1 Tax=Haloarchaeobius sp. HRN-SO-5 TaxID=3446118 RepID=UPI003EC02467